MSEHISYYVDTYQLILSAYKSIRKQRSLSPGYVLGPKLS